MPVAISKSSESRSLCRDCTRDVNTCNLMNIYGMEIEGCSCNLFLPKQGWTHMFTVHTEVFCRPVHVLVQPKLITYQGDRIPSVSKCATYVASPAVISLDLWQMPFLSLLPRVRWWHTVWRSFLLSKRNKDRTLSKGNGARQLCRVHSLRYCVNKKRKRTSQCGSTLWTTALLLRFGERCREQQQIARPRLGTKCFPLGWWLFFHILLAQHPIPSQVDHCKWLKH